MRFCYIVLTGYTIKAKRIRTKNVNKKSNNNNNKNAITVAITNPRKKTHTTASMASTIKLAKSDIKTKVRHILTRNTTKQDEYENCFICDFSKCCTFSPCFNHVRLYPVVRWFYHTPDPYCSRSSFPRGKTQIKTHLRRDTNTSTCTG